MSKGAIGILWALAFVFLESIQFVYFGGLFQHVNSFVFGASVLGITTVAFVGYSAWRMPDQFKRAMQNPKLLWQINITATFAWIAFLGSVQFIEPAIAYTIGAGVMPLTSWAFYKLGWSEGEKARNLFEYLGNWIIGAGLLFLAAITILGLSGFVQGGVISAVIGVVLAIADGVFFTLLLIYCQRLDRAGVGATTVFGLRFPLYVLTAAILGGTTASETSIPVFSELIFLTLIGLLLIVPPLYALQRAVASVTTLTLGALTATGPFIIFVLQIFEGRVSFSNLTLVGLMIYFAGALLTAYGAVKATRQG